MLVWGDDFDQSRTTVVPYLIDDQGHSTKLSPTPGLSQSASKILELNAQSVVVEGGWESTAFKAKSIRPNQEKPRSSTITISSAVVGQQRWLSIMCKFADTPVEPNALSYFENEGWTDKSWLRF